MNDKPTVEVNKLQPITKFIYTLGVLPTSYLMSMTYQEQVTWLCNYISQTVIPAINNDVEAVQELQSLYEDLEDYVNNYFDNLDVQDEINNKLEEMSQDGELTALIKSYVDPTLETFEQQVNTSLASQNQQIQNLVSTTSSTLSTMEQQILGVASGSPLVASDTSEMTDTTRIYVNTTDGYWYYYDGDSWEQGGVYQATEDSDTIDYILYNLLPVVHGNLFNKTTATIGKYLHGSDGHEETNPDYAHSDYIKLYSTNDLQFLNIGLGNACYAYDGSKTIVGRDSIRNFLSNGFPATTVYIRFNLSTVSSNLDTVKVFLNENDVLFDLPNGAIKLSSEDIANSSIINPININVGETRYYTTLNEAVEYANTVASKITPVNLLLDDGEYDVLPTSVLEEADDTFTGLTLADYVNIIGSSTNNTIIKGELPVDISSYAFTRNDVSTINAWRNNTIKNCTITSKNMRYSLHNDDYKTNAVPNAEELFENVVFVSETTSAGVSGISQKPVGIGAYNGRTTKFLNCIFKNENSDVALVLHNSVSSPQQCQWLFDNCDFITEATYALNISSAGSLQDEIVELKGNYLTAGIEFTRQNVYTGTTVEYIVRGYSNVIPSITWISPLVEDDSKVRLIPEVE